ncbi:protein of unknown function [Taphrina deformans PYCC 5710]|uniref:HTH APSES-type domain-containing protein n=1 Tax=Taphrina deformans (strain PYCC 5710 / ATCC 11124 / CBS 356.35 / IMI 108563 / JCM 9778 / NBRC 8474) TaxID=1097556 RepID=R4XDK5_TAPDE|nr:protein of unknown function [Taphrina deformans PYCC 5710]|eukprot:CCG83920.1 protein of unknown function [Taphrina deformans PYCC 5710]
MPPRKAGVERNLPPIRNELMTGEVQSTVLSTKCRVQDVRFGPADEEGTTETFVRIKTQIPHATMPHFIMRKAADNYISATSMYRAVFYKSTTAQEKHEMDVIRKELAARSDENASGVWIPGTPDALQLAEVYGIRPWVQALLDAPVSKSAYPEDQRSPSGAAKSSSPIQMQSSHPSVTETPSRKSTRERSQSPRKTLAASSRKVKKAAKDVAGTIAEDVNEVSEAVKKSVQSASKKVDSAKAAAKSQVESPISVAKSKPSQQVAELAQDLLPSTDQVEDRISATVSSVGQSVTDMMAEARAQVEAAQKKDSAALAESGLGKTERKKKRELEVDENEDGDEEAGVVNGQRVQDGVVSVKRSRVEDLEVVLVQERRKVRALFGLVVGLGVTAVLPYVL